MEEDVGVLKGEVVEMRDELRELREAHGRLSCQVGELNTLAEDMRRQLCYHELLRREQQQGLSPI